VLHYLQQFEYRLKCREQNTQRKEIKTSSF
jgi:hypothetical protein